MDPSSRLTCDQLLDHPYLERRVEMSNTATEQRDQRERRRRREGERDKNVSRSNVSNAAGRYKHSANFTGTWFYFLQNYGLPQLTGNLNANLTQSPTPAVMPPIKNQTQHSKNPKHPRHDNSMHLPNI